MGNKDKASEDLKAILDLLGEWRSEHGYKYVTAAVLRDGYGNAYTNDKNGSDVDVFGDYGSHESETPAARTAGESV